MRDPVWQLVLATCVSWGLIQESLMFREWREMRGREEWMRRDIHGDVEL